MKRVLPLIFFLVLIYIAGSAMAAIPEKPSSFQFVYDYTNTLSSSDKDEISAYGQALLDATGGKNNGDQAVALVVDFLDGIEPTDYATDVINNWGLGDNSLLVLLATGDRDIEIAAGRGLDRLFSAASRGEVIDKNIDYLANNQFSDGLVAIYKAAVTKTATLRGKTLNISQKTTQTGTQTGIPSYGTTGNTISGGSGMGIVGILLIIIIAIIVIRMMKRRRMRRTMRRDPAIPVHPTSPVRPATPVRPVSPRTRAGGVFDNPPAPQRQAPPPPQRNTRTTIPPTPTRSASDRARTTGSVLGGLFSGSSRSSNSSSSSRSSRNSSQSSSSSSSGSLGRSGGSRGSSTGRKF